MYMAFSNIVANRYRKNMLDLSNIVHIYFNVIFKKAQDGVEREVVFQLARNKIEILVELVGINDIFLDRHAYCVTAISMDY